MIELVVCPATGGREYRVLLESVAREVRAFALAPIAVDEKAVPPPLAAFR